MTTIDIRQTQGPITSIRVADRNPNRYIAEFVEKDEDGCGILIKDCSGGTRQLEVRDREHAENLIKALQKAIQMGWV